MNSSIDHTNKSSTRLGSTRTLERDYKCSIDTFEETEPGHNNLNYIVMKANTFTRSFGNEIDSLSNEDMCSLNSSFGGYCADNHQTIKSRSKHKASKGKFYLTANQQTLSSIISRKIPNEPLELKLEKLRHLIRKEKRNYHNLNVEFTSREIRRNASPISTSVNRPAVNPKSKNLEFSRKSYLASSPTRKASLIKGGTINRICSIKSFL